MVANPMIGELMCTLKEITVLIVYFPGHSSFMGSMRLMIFSTQLRLSVLYKALVFKIYGYLLFILQAQQSSLNRMLINCMKNKPDICYLKYLIEYTLGSV